MENTDPFKRNYQKQNVKKSKNTRFPRVKVMLFFQLIPIIFFLLYFFFYDKEPQVTSFCQTLQILNNFFYIQKPARSAKPVVRRRSAEERTTPTQNRKVKFAKKLTKREKAALEKERDASDVAADLREWIEEYEEAVVNHYSNELKARLTGVKSSGFKSNLTQSAPPRCRIKNVKDDTKVRL